MLSAVDLFCGSGGLSAGFTDAGIDVREAYDNWEAAVCTYRLNLANHAFLADLSDVDGFVAHLSKTGSPDIIAGGPPCQDFSAAGKRVEGGRANLTVAFGEIVTRVSPPFFLMENVPRARLSAAYHHAKGAWVKVGYEISEIVLDASRCGCPQARKRFFAFGARRKGAADKFLAAITDGVSDKKLTVKEYLGAEIDVEHYYRHPRNYSRRSVFSVHEPSPTIRGVNRPVPPNYKGNHLDSAPPSTVRPLTSRERSRIQTFPKTWNWGGRDRNAAVEMQIGNAVPVSLASFVGDACVRAAQ